ncbi:oxygenase MpaB family protein [Salegentibacter sp. F188]|uniref:Oxygenase MpaB family protein n=1 Tax=Autumnicola patrickiae TaxID=3075591 RepID=A0ABU3E0A8_9FLAO|nr:oxygenase MpaB family protein [Salegentibacter sp. F188]MDT0688722.1 oxygenase MpaB family protein [Salegentibacter sp. F188]
MTTKYFVDKDSIVRQIWGKGDTILFIFVGASAEFALNKAVDWLYFTGRLPADPLGRLFSTVSYAREIVFSEEQSALRAINCINNIHSAVENSRGAKIPDWAYKDVLFMLIDYSIRSFELLERSLTLAEKQEVFHVFYRVGEYMKLKDLPSSFKNYKKMRQTHLQQDLYYGKYTEDLFIQYQQHLGFVRYCLLTETQNLICPYAVRQFLGFWRTSLLKPVIFFYKISRSIKIDWLLKQLILPPAYKKEIRSLDSFPA